MEKKKATIWHAMIPIGVLIVSLFVAIVFLEQDPHIPLIIGTVTAGLVTVFMLGFSWEEVEESMANGIKLALQSILILMIIGTLVGTWLLSGTVPTLIYYGLQIIAPSVFLIATLLVCSIVSLSVGSSWTTVATIGIALLGIGQGLGFSPPVIAGAIVSGAYFGDKMSPLSETTNLAPSISGTELFKHIRSMLWTTGPAYIITAILFILIGIFYNTGQTDLTLVDEMLAALSTHFTISPILVIPPILVIVIVILKVPAIPGLLIGTVLGGIFAAIFQGAGLAEIIDAAHYGFELETDVEVINDLISGGGLDGMMWTVSLIILALSFGGVLEASGMLHAIGRGILEVAQSTGSLVFATILSCIAINIVSADQYLAIVIPGRMFKDSYKERGIHPTVLSRALESGGTVTSPFIPWNTCGAYMYEQLGVHPLRYAPYAFFNLLVPVINVIFAYTGFKVERLKEES